MRLTTINWIFLTWTAAAALSPEPRPRRHLHEIKQIIANKLFARNEPNCTHSQFQPETKFYSIPGFNDVVIKAVPKSSTFTPPPLIEKIPTNSHIGIIKSYLGTNTLNETYNALVGVKNLVTTGILGAKHGVLQKLTLLKPTTPKPVKPCPSPELISPPPVEPIGVVVNPPKVPKLVPTRYSYKQVNQDGSVTTYTSYLDLNQGVKVTEEGKTLPFVINRLQKIPVELPVPVLPKVSKIGSPFEANWRYPIKVFQPDSSYSYKQVHHDGSQTTYTGLPSSYDKNYGPVFVTGEPSFPKASNVDVSLYDVPAGHYGQVIYHAPVSGGPLPKPVSGGYSYTQIHGNGVKSITHPASGAFDVLKSPAASYSEPFPYNQAYFGAKVATSYAGSGIEKQGPVFSASEPHAWGVQPPSHNSYKHVFDGKQTSYTAAGMINHSTPPYFNGRMEKVTTGAKFNPKPYSEPTVPLVNRFAVPIPPDFVQIPSVQTSVPQRSVKIPSASGTSPFVYKHVHSDGTVTTYGGGGSVNEQGFKSQAPNPAMLTSQGYFTGNNRVFESPIYTSPFPMNVNPNSFKPSTPVSSSYSYKLLNNGQVDYHYDVGPNEQFSASGFGSNQPFPLPPVFPVIPGPVQGCVDTGITNPMGVRSSGLNQEAVPQSYSYRQSSHDENRPLITVNAEDPVMAANKMAMRITESNQFHHNYPSEFQNVREDYYLDPKDYVYIPPERYDEIPPPIKPLQFPKYPPKKFSNRWLYEIFDGYNFTDEKFNQPPTTFEPQGNSVSNNPITVSEEVTISKNPARNVYIEQAPAEIPYNFQPVLSNRNPEYRDPTIVTEQVPIPNNPTNNANFEPNPSSPKPILSKRKSLTKDPIVIPEQSSFLFKQSNPDGSTITTKNDDRNILSVQVEEAPKPESVQTEELPKHDEVEVYFTSTPSQEQVDEVPITVSVSVEPTTEEPESAPSTKLPRRRKIKRVLKQVKHRGDIPDAD